MSRETRKEKYYTIPVLLLMRCIRPLLCEMLHVVVERKKLPHQRTWSIDDYLLHNRKKIERKVQKFDESEKYVDTMFSKRKVEIEKWDTRLTIFMLVDICMIDTNSKYYLEDVENIVSHLSNPNASKITRHIYKEYKKRLRKARSRFYKFIDNDCIKRRIEKRAKKIEDGRTNESDGKKILVKWKEVESTKNQGKGCMRNGLDRSLTINVLLSEPCCDVMRAVITKRVSNMRYRSLDEMLQKEKRRIIRRIEGLDSFGRPEEILFPRNRKMTQLHEWDLTLLCWILLNVCRLNGIITNYHQDALADAIGKFREVRNKTVHKASLNISENDYQSYLKDIKDSIDICLVYIADPDFSEDIVNKVEEIEAAVLTKDETIKRLQICQNDRADYKLQSNYLQGQHSIIQALSTIVRKFTGIKMPESSLELVLTNCSEECEKKLSEILVDNINQLVNGNGTSNDDLKEALEKLIERFKQRGWKTSSAEYGSVLLHVKCASFEELAALYKIYGNTGSTLGTSEIQEVVQRQFGCHVNVSIVMYMREMDRCLENIVDSMLEEINRLTNADGSKKIRLWLESDQDSKQSDRSTFLDKRTRDELENVANILRNRYSIPSLSISASLQGEDTKVDENRRKYTENFLKATKTTEKSLNSDRISTKTSVQELKRAKQYLNHWYKTDLSKWSHSFADEHYIPLELEVNDTNNVGPVRRCQGCSKIITERKLSRKLQHYLEIFTNEGCQPNFIYIVGDAGMGKSTLCQKIVSDWCTAHSNEENCDIKGLEKDTLMPLRQYEFLFKISHRNTPSNTNEITEKTIANQIGIPENIVMECLQKHFCLIIIDGLDEWQVEKKDTRHQGLLNLKFSDKCTHLITSRPWQMRKPPDGDNILSITIKGFSAANREIKIKAMLSHLLKAQNKYSIKARDDYFSKFKNEIRSIKYDDLLKNPMMLELVVSSLVKFGSQSLCNTYVQLIKSIFPRHAGEKGSSISSCRSAISLQPKTESLNIAEGNLSVLPLCKLAFEMMVFADNPFGSACYKCIVENIMRPEEVTSALKTGFLTSESNELNSISFINKSVQEFFAARFVNIDCLRYLSMIKEKTCTVESALQLRREFLFLFGLNQQALKQLLWHLKDIIDADKRFQMVRFKGEHKQFERIQYRILVKSVSDMIMDCVAESLYSIPLDYTLVLRDLYIDNDSLQTVTECFPYIRTSYLKSLHINCDSNLTSAFTIAPIVEKTKDVIEMLQTSNVKLFERLFLMPMRSLKSLELRNLVVTHPQFEQLLKSAPKLSRVALYNFESKKEIYALLTCNYLSVSDCARSNHLVVCVDHSMALKGPENYPALQELILELFNNDFITMKNILLSRKCGCANFKDGM